MAKPPLDLQVQFRDPDGTNGQTFTHYNTKEEGQATLGNLTTKYGTGFESMSCTLNRDIRKTYGVPRIMQEAVVSGAGKSVWEGRVDRVPPSRANSVEASGWYQATKDVAGVSEVYKASDVSEWGGMPLNRRAAFATGGSFAGEDGMVSDGAVITKMAQPTWTAGHLPVTEAWYTAPPGVSLATLYAAWAKTSSVNTGPDDYFWRAALAADDAGASGDGLSTDLQAAGPSTVTRTATVTGRRYAILQLGYAAAFATDDSADRRITWTDVAVYGDHGLSNIYASEVIKHAVGKYCPLLTADSSTITDTTYAIGHLVFDGARVEDVLLRCNAFHLFEIAVWEGRKLYFNAAKPLDDYDYELSIYEGADLEPAGPEVDDEEPANGVWVYYTDVSTGRRERVGPYGTGAGYDSDGDTALLVSDDENPVNRAGTIRFPSLEISYNCTRADAILMGSLWLAERQIPTTVGTGSAEGHVKNRAGQWVPAWEIRAGDRVKYTHETGVIRRVHGTSYDPQTHTISLTFERPASTVEGVFERIGVSLQAANAK